MPKHEKASDHENKFLDSIPGIIMGGVGSLITLIIGAFLGSQLPPSAQTSINIITALVILVVFAGVWWLARDLPASRLPIMIVSFVTAAVLCGILYFVWAAFQEQRTIYLLVDASGNMAGTLKDIGPYIKLKAVPESDKIEAGLGVFGGGLSNNNGCNDLKQLVNPLPQQTSGPRISGAVDLLVQVKPSNYGGLQNAILFAIDQLRDRKGLQQIVVITSGIDKRCGKLDRKALLEAAAQDKIDLQLVVATVGNITDKDKEELQSLAKGAYTNSANAADFGKTIDQIVTTPPSPIQRFYYGANP